jgi:hypothetical protein
VEFDLPRLRRPKNRQVLPRLGLSLVAALVWGGTSLGQAPNGDMSEVWHKPTVDRTLASALYGGVDPAASTLNGRTARIPMFRMLPGFLSDPANMPGSDDASGGTDAGLLCNFGEDNPYFDPRRPGDPGGVGFVRVYSQLQLLDTGTTSISVGLRAWTPAGLENGGVADGPTYFAPGLGIFQDLGNGTALHGYVGQQFRAELRGSTRQSALEYGMAMHCPVPGLVEPTNNGVYVFVQALGRYGYVNPYDGREMEWEFVPGVHWRLSDNFWMSVGASRRSIFTCSWQF